MLILALAFAATTTVSAQSIVPSPAAVYVGGTTNFTIAAAPPVIACANGTANGKVSLVAQQSSTEYDYMFAPTAMADAGYVTYDIAQGNDCASATAVGQLELFHTEDCPVAGTWGRGKDCAECPEGAICPGGYRMWAKPGYWTPSEDAGYVVRCEPASACLGGMDGECASGYSGDFCAEYDAASPLALAAGAAAAAVLALAM